VNRHNFKGPRDSNLREDMASPLRSTAGDEAGMPEPNMNLNPLTTPSRAKTHALTHGLPGGRNSPIAGRNSSPSGRNSPIGSGTHAEAHKDKVSI
jgi:hypothetical protein